MKIEYTTEQLEKARMFITTLDHKGLADWIARPVENHQNSIAAQRCFAAAAAMREHQEQKP